MLSTQTKLAQIQAHFVAGFEAQGFVEAAAFVAGVESYAGEAFALAPVEDRLHELAGDAAAAVVGVGIDVENCGAATFQRNVIRWN